jgi:MOSC domain-containing protein YiiM
LKEIQIRSIYISPGHNFFGRYGKAAGTSGTVEVEEAQCRAGCGIEGDRFFAYKPDYRGQITFFSEEVHDSLSAALQVFDRGTEVYRRNVITLGINLNELIGKRFRIGEILFEGTEECRPCLWMNEAFGAGAEEFLKGQGGLRARILTDGKLAPGPAKLSVEP